MAVVAAGELHDEVAAGEPAGEPDRGHGGLGAGGDQPDLLDRRAAPRSPRRARPRSASGCRTTCRGTPPRRRLPGPRVGVAEQERAPRADQVDVLVAVDVAQPGAGPEAMNRGVPPTALKARTGELTPPGVTRWARSNQRGRRLVRGPRGLGGADGTWHARILPDHPYGGTNRPPWTPSGGTG